MSADGSITVWLEKLCDRDDEAAQKIWETYYCRLVGLVRAKLRALPRAASDEEDVALSAFDSFFRGAERGRFPRLKDRDDLWQILLMIAERKVYDRIEHDGRAKRDWRRTAPTGELVLQGKEPDPAFAVQVAEQCERLLASLADEDLRLIAIRKMEGYTNPEIADEVGCSLATVERRLRLLRREWQSHFEQDAGL